MVVIETIPLAVIEVFWEFYWYCNLHFYVIKLFVFQSISKWSHHVKGMLILGFELMASGLLGRSFTT
jgi:hypothetical protein